MDFFHSSPPTPKAISLEDARHIMGTSLIGSDEAQRIFGDIDPAHLAHFECIPFSDVMLRAHAQTHILVADLGNSMADMRDRLGPDLFESQWEVRGYASREADEIHRLPVMFQRDSPQWRLVPRVTEFKSLFPEVSWYSYIMKHPLRVDLQDGEDALLMHRLVEQEFRDRYDGRDARRWIFGWDDKTWAERLAMLDLFPLQYIPSLRQLAYAFILVALARHERMYPGLSAIRTTDADDDDDALLISFSDDCPAPCGAIIHNWCKEDSDVTDLVAFLSPDLHP